AAGGPPEFGREAVGVDLKLLHGVLAELVRGAARPGAAERLAEKEVVVIHAVNLDAVERALLAAEGEVAAARVAHDAGRQRDEVQEVAPVNGQLAHLPLAHRAA